MKIKFLAENKTSTQGLLAEHGLSLLIETGDRKILFDTGVGNVLFHNAEAMNVDLEEIYEVVISHGHYDHTGGVPRFCEINKKAKVYIHEKAFAASYSMKNGKLAEKNSGIRWSTGVLDEIRERLFLTDGIYKITEDIVISGTIPVPHDYETREKFYIKGENGNLSVDPMDHEQFLAIRERDEKGSSKGVFVFSGCSHKGILPVLKYAKQLFPSEKILGFIGGLHLYRATPEVMINLIEELIEERVEMIMPVHCTGINAICDLKYRMGKRCILAETGDSYEF